MATTIGSNNADILSGTTTSADLVSAAGGNDTLVYTLATAGGADKYYGGTGVDTLELRFTSAEWAALSSTLKTNILSMKSAIAAAPKVDGAVATGRSFGTLDFGAGKTLAVYEVESLKIMIDGVESDGTTPAPNSPVTITSATTSGSVVEDGTLKATGVVNFTDANLADTHTVTVTPAAGQTALGAFSLGAVSESATTAAGSVAWAYNLDNASEAVQALAAGQVVTEKYTLSITDGKGSTVTQEVVITITGAYDAPQIKVTNEGTVSEAGNGSAGTPVATGRFAPDSEIPAGAVWSTFGDPDATLGTFEISSDGVWTYTVDNELADSLGAGETQLIFSVVATFTVDGVEQTVEREVSVVVNGVDDKSVVAVVGEQDLDVIEAGGDANGTDTDPGASGELSLTDADSVGAAFTPETIEGTYGDLTITADGKWGYVLRNDDDNVQALKAGQKVTDAVTVTTTDGVSHVITINITGAADNAAIYVVDTKDDSDPTVPFVDALGNTTLASNVATDPLFNGDTYYDNTVVEASGIKNGTNADATASGQFKLVAPDSNVTFKALTNAAPTTVDADDDGIADDADGDGVADLHYVAGSGKGFYGDFTLDTATGKWSYALRNNDANVQALTDTDTVEDKLVVLTSDGGSAVITVKITGGDDAVTSISNTLDGTAGSLPDVQVVEEYTDADGNVVAADTAAAGQLVANDPDGGAAVTFIAVKDTDGDGKVVGKYGDFTLDSATGAWTYTAAATLEGADGVLGTADDYLSLESLKAGTTTTESMVVKSSDGGASYAVTVNLKGHNDAATFEQISVAADGTVTILADEVLVDSDGDGEVDSVGTPAEWNNYVVEAGGVNNATNEDPLAGGILRTTDVDTGETGFKSTSALKGTYGDFTFNLTSGAWTYKLRNGDTNVQQLRAGEEKTETLVVTAKDGTTHDLVVRVVGANDEATITEVAGADKTVVEAGGKNNAIAGDAVAKGQFTIADPDGSGDTSEATFSTTVKVGGGLTLADANAAADLLGEVDVASATTAIQGAYGEFTFDVSSGKWNYALKNDWTTTQHLLAGQKAVDTLTIYSAEGSVSKQIVVNVTGANDIAAINSLPGADTSVQAGGKDKAVNGVAAPIAEDLDASGTLAVFDPDFDMGSQPTVGFKPVVASALNGKYGTFTFDATSGAWTYALNPADADTLALLAGQSAQDKLAVTAADGSVYTVVVNVAGANNEVVLVDAPVVNTGAGTMTYKVLDGDAGAKLSMEVVDAAGVVRTYGATTVLDGKVSTLSIPTSAGTSVVAGTLQVWDNTTDHAHVALDAYLGLGTNADNAITADPAVANGALMAGYAGDDTLTGTDSTDYISGGADDDMLSGLAGNDKIDAGTGNDTVDGGDGDDTIVGLAGNDYLDGGAGADILEGGLGKDTLEGSAGDADTFVFRAATDMGALNFDVIVGFESGTDHIQLGKALLPTTMYLVKDAVGADGINEVYTAAGKTLVDVQDAAGTKVTIAKNADVAGAWFRSDLTVSTSGFVSAGLGAEDRVVYDATTGTLWYDADGKSSTAAVKIAVLDGAPALTASDIQFI